ncbi:MAG: Type II secretion system protein F [Fimbriimonadaceae bacterium]|nr:Type II secretion system protein F [Fimbriimonadaceae bacterium]
MPIFEYQAKDAEGKHVRGTIHGGSIDVALQTLATKGLQVESLGAIEQGLERTTEGGSAPPNITSGRPVLQANIAAPLFERVPLPQLGFFFRQAAALLGAGVAPSQAFETLARQMKGRKLSSVISELRQHSIEGRPMSFGMQRYPEVFSPLMIALVRAGEEGGFLVDTLKTTSEYVEREIELRNSIKRQTFYPKLVLFASIVIFGGANFVIQSATGVAGSLPNPLLQPAAMLIWIPLVIAVVLYLRIGLQNQRLKFDFDKLITKIPGIGGVVHGLSMAKFGRAFGALYKGGVPIPRALELGADACGNEFVRASIYPAGEALKAGAGITESFRATGAFSDIVLDMCSAGEMSGNLDEMLIKVSEYYEDECKTRSDQMAMLFGVVCLLAVGVYVGWLLIQAYGGYASSRVGAGGE